MSKVYRTDAPPIPPGAIVVVPVPEQLIAKHHTEKFISVKPFFSLYNLLVVVVVVVVAKRNIE